MREPLKSVRSNADARIDVKESWDLNFWCDELGLRSEELKEIVKVVGPNIHDVRLYLAKKMLLEWPSNY